MTPVPAGGFPKITRVVSRRSSPTARASACWSMTAKTLTPLDPSRSTRRATVSATGRGLVLVTTPSAPAIGVRKAAARTGRAAWLSRSRSAVSRSRNGMPMPMGTVEVRSLRHWTHSTTHVRSGPWETLG